MTDDVDAQPGRPATGEQFLILGTAGHIDHGKTSLVKALTGVNTDRLPEEKRRGMTIELGFAELTIEGVHFGIVDVPGHERFVRTMVAGATGIDMALIVIAGDDSVMPQTVEHVEVLKLMGIEQAVVAITKCDLVDASLLDLVEEEVRDLLSETPFADAPVVKLSSTTGTGIDELKRQLASVARHVPTRNEKGPFRMAIDRVFVVQGRGTVVTGSVIQGVVRPGDTLEVHPGERTCRVRDLQSHGRHQPIIQVGQRAAVNLIGLDRGQVERGHELAAPGLIVPSRRMDAAFELLSSCKAPLKPSSVVRVCMGTRELRARILPLNGAAVRPGVRAYVQIRSREGMFATFGQRYIVRTENASQTIGGGVILRPVAGRWLSDRESEARSLRTLETGSPAERLLQVLTETGFAAPGAMLLSARTRVEPDRLPSLLDRLASEGQWVSVDGSDRRVVPVVVDRLFKRADSWLERYHHSHPDEPGCHIDSLIGWLERKSARGLGRPLFDRYVGQNRVKIRGRFVCLPAFAPSMSAQDERVFGRMLKTFEDGAFQPPSLGELAKNMDTETKRIQRLAKLAVAEGMLAEIGPGLFLSAANESKLREIVSEMITSEGGVAVAQVRGRLNSSRKYVVPFLEYLDRVRFTVRRGDLRVLHEDQVP